MSELHQGPSVQRGVLTRSHQSTECRVWATDHNSSPVPDGDGEGDPAEEEAAQGEGEEPVELVEHQTLQGRRQEAAQG